MSKTIYASKIEADNCIKPVFDFKCADPEILADDSDARESRGESAFIANPDYVEDAFMDLADGNAETLFGSLGLKISGGAEFPLDQVYAAALKGLAGAAAQVSRPVSVSKGAQGATFIDCGLPVERMQAYLQSLLQMIWKSRSLGATHIVVV